MFFDRFLDGAAAAFDSLSPTLKNPTVSSVDQKHSCILHVSSRVDPNKFFLGCSTEKKLALDYYEFKIFVEMYSRLIIFRLEFR